VTNGQLLQQRYQQTRSAVHGNHSGIDIGNPMQRKNLKNRADYQVRFFEPGLVKIWKSKTKSDRLFDRHVIFVCFWSLLEAPLELVTTTETASLAAVAVSKLLIVLIGFSAISNVCIARRVFAFICATRVFAIALALPLEYKSSNVFAIVSTVECLGKGACVFSLLIASRRNTRNEETSCPM
jgi:hypothetical protein